MKRLFLAMFGVAAIVGCTQNDVVSESAAKYSREVPIEFSVQKQNITRAVATSKLEDLKHYNFGVFAYKVQGKNGIADQEVMNNYLVGYSDGSSIGYDKTKATTWASAAGTTSDHTSPWFYEGLGTAEYTYEGDAGFYKKTQTDYMSNNANQYLRYWDLAYAKTNFYCYAPYNKDVTFDKTTSKLTFPATSSIRDGYDLPLNSAYDAYSRTLGEFMYAGVQATNENLADVTIPFKHMGAQLFIRFYEDIPGYKVEIVDLNADNGKMNSAATGYKAQGIQAAPSVKSGDSYSKGYYYTHSGATINFTESSGEAAEPTYNWSNEKKVQTPLMFKIPQTVAGEDPYETSTVAPGNLTSFTASRGNTTSHNVIQEKVTEGGTQNYSYSPTIYYPVAQPQSSASEYQNSGLTFHISFRIIAEDNGEVTTIHNATVHVPVSGDATEGASGTYPITAWKSNVKYTYTFKFTKNATGTTDPGTEIDPTDPAPSTKKSMYPIVFDSATIDDYTENFSEYIVSTGTAY